MAMDEPMIDPVLIGVLNAITEATMITTRLMVFPTACVTGLTYKYLKKKCMRRSNKTIVTRRAKSTLTYLSEGKKGDFIVCVVG
jgi:hypothetical protein